MAKIELFKTMAEFAKAGWKPSDVNDMLDRLEKIPENNDDSADDLNEEKPSDNQPKEPSQDPLDAIIERNNK